MTDHDTLYLSPLRHRVLQVHGRRFSIRLEEAYWQVLEELARRRGQRLARVIADVAAEAEGEASLAAALRLRCLDAVLERLEEGGRAGAGAAGAGAARFGTSLENLITANPAPSLLVAHDGEILLANRAFENWSGVKAEALTGKRYDWFFQLRLPGDLKAIIEGLAAGTEGHQPARLSYIAPGRVVVANGVICLGHYVGPGDFTWIIMVGNVAASGGAAPAP